MAHANLGVMMCLNLDESRIKMWDEIAEFKKRTYLNLGTSLILHMAENIQWIRTIVLVTRFSTAVCKYF